MGMKNIYIHVSLHFSGGVGAVVKQLVKHQVACGDEVYLVAREGDQGVGAIADKSDVNTIFLKRRPLKILPRIITGNNLKKIYNQIKQNNKNSKVVMICHGVGIIGLFGKVKRENTIVVLHGHINKSGMALKVFYSMLFGRFRKLKFVACSNECASYYRDGYKINPCVILNGCDVQGEKKAQYPSTKTLCVGMVANMDSHKGFKYFLEAINNIDYTKLNVKFYLVGENAENFNFENYIAENNLQTILKYYGNVPDAANTIMSLLDLLVLPSKMEGLPMSLIEALSYGIPILATKVGGIPEILRDGYNGYFIKRDGADIAKKIELCCDPTTYLSLSKNALYCYNSAFSSNKMCSNYDKYIEKNIG